MHHGAHTATRRPSSTKYWPLTAVIFITKQTANQRSHLITTGKYGHNRHAEAPKCYTKSARMDHERTKVAALAEAANAALVSSAPYPPAHIFTGHVFAITPSPRHATIADIITSRGGTVYDAATTTPAEPEPQNLIRYNANVKKPGRDALKLSLHKAYKLYQTPHRIGGNTRADRSELLITDSIHKGKLADTANKKYSATDPPPMKRKTRTFAYNNPNPHHNVPPHLSS